MKNFLTALWRAICDASVLFTATVMFFAVFIFNTNTAHFTKETLLAFFWFSLIFGLAGFIHCATALPSFIRHAVRLVVTSIGFAVFVLTSAERSEMQMFVAVIVFALSYIAVFALSRLFLIPFRKKDKVEEE